MCTLPPPTVTGNACATARSPCVLSTEPPPRPLNARADRCRRTLIAAASREPRCQPPLPLAVLADISLGNAITFGKKYNRTLEEMLKRNYDEEHSIF